MYAVTMATVANDGRSQQRRPGAAASVAVNNAVCLNRAVAASSKTEDSVIGALPYTMGQAFAIHFSHCGALESAAHVFRTQGR